MHIIIILLVIIILLLGGWWIFAVGIGFLLAAIGAVVGAIVWLIKALWPFLSPLLAVGFIGFLILGTIGWVREAKGGRKAVRKVKPSAPVRRELPPISRTWAERKKNKKDVL